MKLAIILLLAVGSVMAGDDFLLDPPNLTKGQSDSIGREMVLFCLTVQFGKTTNTQKVQKIIGDMIFPLELKTRELKLKHGTISYSETGDGRLPYVSATSDADTLICDAIQKFGKKGKLVLNTGPFRLPESNEFYSVEVPPKGNTIFTLIKPKATK